MEGSESDSVSLSISNGEEPQLGRPSSPAAPPEPSDLNHAAEEETLSGELQSKLDLKDVDESLDIWSVGLIYLSDPRTGFGFDIALLRWNCWIEKKGIFAFAEVILLIGGTGLLYYFFRLNKAVKEKAGEREETTERSGMTECKYYQRSGGCKFGKSCKYNHTRGKISTAPAPLLELNFLGLPIRPGERECPYYMRTGSCKFGANCKFNHPDPTAVGGGGGNPPSGYGNGGSISLQGVSQTSVPSWSSPRTLNEASPFVPMMLSPTQGVSTQSSDWNGYQVHWNCSKMSIRIFEASVYLPERSIHPPSTFVMNNPAIDTNVYMHHQKQMPVDEFPERPGEPECSFFLKTGDCKFKSNCKFHHPKNRVTRLPPCNLSDKGLPLRPDQSVCSHYSRYGICKFGPACKFDHPINLQPVMIPGLEQQSYSNSASAGVAGIGGSTGVTDATIQQSV
ncbi:hypothetical protein JHK82_011781 [Glycine max]|nr:hypothetical protein JHK82_011781 [Glycine max]